MAYSGIPRIEAVLTAHLGPPKNKAEAAARKALAADILLKLKGYCRESIREGKPGWAHLREEVVKSDAD